MGVDCKILLPHNVQVRDVADVIGVAAGLKTSRSVLSGHNDYWSLKVEGVNVAPSCVLTLADIQLTAPDGTFLVDGEVNHHVNYHFEGEGGRLLMPRSTAFWIGIGRRLVDFFGGKMDYQDCDDEYEDYTKWPKSSLKNRPQDGKPWQNFQKRMEAVKPLTTLELEAFDRLAAYKMADR